MELVIAQAGQKMYQRQFKLEDFINEHTTTANSNSKLKNDAEVQLLLTNLVQIFTDWKTEMKIYLAKSPLLEDGLS
jgi:hypothetical protein